MSSENISTTAPPSMETIESEIKLIDVKKAELKKAFDDLQANSNHLSSSFCISWLDIESHFTAMKNSVTQRFRALESHDSARNNPTQQQHRVDSVTDSVLNQPLTQPDPVPLNIEKPSCSNSLPPSRRTDLVVARPELKDFCERMDWKGLMKYMFDHAKERESIRIELPVALKSAPDPGAMVLDAMEGFYDDKDPGLIRLRKVCLVLLQQLMETGLSFREEVRERAKMLALEWKVKLHKDNSLETMSFLHLVATYSLGAMFDKEELVDYIFTLTKFRPATRLCRAIGLGEKIHDLIQKLLDNGKQLFAVRFIFEFGLTEKFPPVPLLDEYLKETEKLAKQVCKDGNNSLSLLKQATDKEIAALKCVKKIIEECNLEIEYSLEPLQKRIEQLEKEYSDMKSPAMPSAPTPPPPQQQQQQAKKKNKQSPGEQQQSGNKHPKTAASFVPPSVIPPFQQPHHQPAGILPNHSAAYLSSSAIPFGLQGSRPFAAPPAPMYGLAGAPRGFPVNPIPAPPPLYNYGRPPAYGAYDFTPQYRPYFHPR